SGLAVGVIAVLAAIVAVAPLIGARVNASPGDPRGLVQPPNLDVLDQNPLSRLGGWATNPDQVLFSVTILAGGKPTPSPSPAPSPSPPPTASASASASADPYAPEVTSTSKPLPATSVSAHDTRLRLAVLPDWDGITWHMDADYRSAGRVLPAVPAPPG